MPVSHVGLTVSHLPTSTSFFLAALQPLGYRYIGQSGDQIGLGIHNADFFLCQETPGMKAGSAHIAFTASSATAVKAFYAAALMAGGRPNGAPAARCEQDGHFNAAVYDFDGNSIEVSYRDGPDVQKDGTVIEHSRVYSWQRSVARSYRDDQSVASVRTSVSRSAHKDAIPQLPRRVSEPIVPPTTNVVETGDGAAKKIIGTLIGAAAGAAVAYAMVKSERDSEKKELNFDALMQAKNTVIAAAQFFTEATSAPKEDTQPAPQPTPQPVFNAAHAPPHASRRASDVSSTYALGKARSVLIQSAIDDSSPSVYMTPQSSGAPSDVGGIRAIEYRPAPSIVPSQARSNYANRRSVTMPVLPSAAMAKSVTCTTTKNPYDDSHSVASSTFISTFVPDVPRQGSEGSVLSARSHTKSSHSKHGGGSSKAKVVDDDASIAPTTLSKPPSKAGSIIDSLLGRRDKSSPKHETTIQELDNEDSDDDFQTVVPSDSISNAGRKKHRKHKTRSKTDDASVASSRHGKSSHHRSRTTRHSDASSTSADEAGSPRRSKPSSRPPRHASWATEPSETSTVKPAKRHSSSSSSAAASKHKSRKDSLTQGPYDNLFAEIRSTRKREVTPSVASAARKNTQRGMVNYSMAQKARVFEGQVVL